MSDKIVKNGILAIAIKVKIIRSQFQARLELQGP
jgi:hypothetical protein